MSGYGYPDIVLQTLNPVLRTHLSLLRRSSLRKWLEDQAVIEQALHNDEHPVLAVFTMMAQYSHPGDLDVFILNADAFHMR